MTYKKSMFTIPLVLQYNKRDLGEQDIPMLPIETLETDLNAELKAPIFEASALSGKNVVETLKKIITMTIFSLEKELK